jgi:hypothetical protein
MTAPANLWCLRYRKACASIALVAAILVLWPWSRRPTEADRVIAELRAKGERFSLAEMELQPPSTNDTALNLMQSLDDRLEALQGRDPGVMSGEPANPPNISWKHDRFFSWRGGVLEWSEAEALVDDLADALKPLHEALGDPPLGPGGDDYPYATSGTVVDSAVLERVVEGLHGQVIVELHRGRREPALRCLLTLLRCAQVRRDSHSAKTQHDRLWSTTKACDAVWQFLQADGWSEGDLRAVQEELARIDLLTAWPRSYEIERVVYLASLEDHRQTGVHLGYFAGSGTPPSWRKGLYDAQWETFRYHRLRMDAIGRYQVRIDQCRGLAAGMTVAQLPEEDRALGFSGVGAWFQNWILARGGLRVASSACGPLFPTVALDQLVAAESMRRLAIIAVALERHRLRHGSYPSALSVLAPAFLAKVPTSPSIGEPFLYRLTSFGHVELKSPPPGSSEMADWPSLDAACFVGWSPTDTVSSLIQMEETPVSEVIERLAVLTRVDLEFSPGLREELSKPLSLRLEYVAARNLLHAVILNEGLCARYDKSIGYIISRRP